MIRSLAVADFLRAEGVDTSLPAPVPQKKIKIVPDASTPAGEIIAQPDRLVAVVVTGGAGTTHERHFDRATVQLFARGLQRSDEDAEALAEAADNALMGAVPPVDIGSVRVISIDYLGGPPALVSRDDGKRALFSCSYVLQATRTAS